MMRRFADPSQQRGGALVMGGCVSCLARISVPLPHAGPLIAAQSGQSRAASTHWQRASAPRWQVGRASAHIVKGPYRLGHGVRR